MRDAQLLFKPPSYVALIGYQGNSQNLFMHIGTPTLDESKRL